MESLFRKETENVNDLYSTWESCCKIMYKFYVSVKEEILSLLDEDEREGHFTKAVREGNFWAESNDRLCWLCSADQIWPMSVSV